MSQLAVMVLIWRDNSLRQPAGGRRPQEVCFLTFNRVYSGLRPILRLKFSFKSVEYFSAKSCWRTNQQTSWKKKKVNCLSEAQSRRSSRSWLINNIYNAGSGWQVVKRRLCLVHLENISFLVFARCISAVVLCRQHWASHSVYNFLSADIVCMSSCYVSLCCHQLYLIYRCLLSVSASGRWRWRR